jgi:hypothetical protein
VVEVENNRNLSGPDVSNEAVESVKDMTIELADSLVKDYVTSLNKDGKTMDVGGIDLLTKFVIDTAVISMKINIKVNAKVLEGLGISILYVNQSNIDEYKT